MVRSIYAWFHAGWSTIGASLAAIGLIALTVLASRLHRAADLRPPDDSDQAKPATSLVQLDRPELVAAAGIEVAPVTLHRMEGAQVCNGTAEFNQNRYVKVPPKADGILRAIKVDVGDRVEAGDVLAIVDSQTFGDLKASYLKALVHEDHLRWQLERYKTAGEGVAAKSLYETQHLLEEQVTDTARIVARLHGFGLSSEQITALVKSKDIGIQLNVVAPRAGTIVERHAVEGEPVETIRPLFAIADLDTLWVSLHLYDRDLPYVHLDQAVTFFADGLGGQGFAGRVTWISPEVDATTRTIQLRAEVTNRDGLLRAHMFGRGELELEKAHERVVVPQAAVQSHAGGHVVFVAKANDRFERRTVEIGQKDGELWEIRHGLSEGERVATVGSFLLKSNLENANLGKVE